MQQELGTCEVSFDRARLTVAIQEPVPIVTQAWILFSSLDLILLPSFFILFLPFKRIEYPSRDDKAKETLIEQTIMNPE